MIIDSEVYIVNYTSLNIQYIMINLKKNSLMSVNDRNIKLNKNSPSAVTLKRDLKCVRLSGGYCSNGLIPA